MVVLKTAAELTAMRDAGRISAQALLVGGEAVKPGVTTAEIDRKIHKFILSQGAKPSFLGYGGFPGSACISVNDEVSVPVSTMRSSTVSRVPGCCKRVTSSALM